MGVDNPERPLLCGRVHRLVRASVFAVAVAVVALAGAAFYAASTLREGGGEAAGQGGNWTFHIAPGDVLYYNVTGVAVSPEGNVSRSSAVNRVEVAHVAPPLLVAAVSAVQGNASTNSTTVPLPYGIIALPAEQLGRESVAVPLSIASTTACVELRLEGREPGSPLGGDVYVYRGSVSEPNLTVAIEARYDADTGALARLEARVEVGGGGTLTVTQELVNATLSGGSTPAEPMEAACWNGFSADLRFTLEGIYKLTPQGYEPISAKELGDAIQEKAVVAVLYKPCPHCQRFWPTLLRAVNETGVTVYAIVLGQPGASLTTWDLSFAYTNIAFPAMNKTGATGFPALILFKGGEAISATAGEMTLDKLESWLQQALLEK